MRSLPPPSNLKNLEALECGIGHDISYSHLKFLLLRWSPFFEKPTIIHGQIDLLNWQGIVPFSKRVSPQKVPLIILGTVKKLFVPTNVVEEISLGKDGRVEELHLLVGDSTKMYSFADNTFYHPRSRHVPLSMAYHL